MNHSVYLTVIDPSKPCEKTLESPAKTYAYPLDPFQQHALCAIEEGQNVLVTAKTGSGKTLVGEYLIHKILRDGGRVFYTTPIKSLSNQKFHDLKREFGQDRVGIMTGDIKFNPDAQVIVMTTEILRNLLFKQGTSTEHLGLTAALSLKGLKGVVFDEVHYINDRDRGRVWEETLILLPAEIQMVLLSATIDRADLFASWLGDLKQKPISLISTQYRVVPLTHGILIGTQFQTLMDSKEIYNDGTYRNWIDWRSQKIRDHEAFQRKVKEQRAQGHEGAVSGKVRPASFQHQMNETIRALEQQKLLPALCFVFSRVGCEKYADKVEPTLLDSSDAAKVRHIWDFHLHSHKDILETMPQAHKLRALAERGIAYHHSGLVPILKEIIEILFSRGLIKLLFATETFAVGLNMPTKTVLFFGLEKFSDDVGGLRPLRTDEYIQMAGRAGRRGLDPVGTVIYLPERDPVEPSTMKAMLTGGRSPIISKMSFHYEFLLKTLQAGSLTWLSLMEKSYWFLQHKEQIAATKRAIQAAKEKRDALGLKDYEISAVLERESLEAQLKASQNAKKREAQRLLEMWKNKCVGPRWEAVWKLWPQSKQLDTEVAEESRHLSHLEAYMDSIQPLVSLLQAHGFLAGPESLDASSLTKDHLSPKGQMATEINEGHPILMTELYAQRLAHHLQPEEILAVLTGFLQEEGDPDKSPPIERLRIPKAVCDVLYKMSDVACDYYDSEKKHGVTNTPHGFWDLNSYWIEPIWRWLQGDDASALCAEYGIFEGNLLRAILKVSNLLEEWTVLATFNKDIEMLEHLRGLDTKLKHGIATTDSLYLRLV
jgi:superfamily II RNA helicase